MFQLDKNLFVKKHCLEFKFGLRQKKRTPFTSHQKNRKEKEEEKEKATVEIS